MANAIAPARSIRDCLAGGRKLPWREVMELALYEPGVGYYRRGVRSIGRAGDFFTSVSVGPVFGELLALFCAQVWHALGSPQDFGIIEQGAHDGQLAADLMRGLKKHEPVLAEQVRLLVIEPDEELRNAQRTTLREWLPQVTHMNDLALPPDFPRHAVFLSNELLDAFPVHRVVFDASRSQWGESWVEERDGALSFVEGDPENETLREELRLLPAEAPDGCITEVNLGMLQWLREVAALPFSGAVLTLDYGFTMDEWLSSGNVKGTLSRYRNHQSDDRILEDLGECDLTSHVNFTRLAQEARALGMPVLDFMEQGRFLTHTTAACLGRAGTPPDAAWLRQFQTLTHPGMMGRNFHALMLGKGHESAVITTPQRQEAAGRRLGLVYCLPSPTLMSAPVTFFNRHSGRIETEAIYGEGFLRWAYENPLGRLALWALVKRSLFSHWYGWRMNRPASRAKIAPFIAQYGTNVSEMLEAPESFANFNAFFSRKLKPEARPISSEPSSIAFPADGRHFVIPDLAKNDGIFVKGVAFDLSALLCDGEELTQRFANGSMLISRLCPVDYHRFHFPCDGMPHAPHLINGPLYSVNPLALRQRPTIFWENKRFVTSLTDTPCGEVLFLEVGATCVGSVQKTYSPGNAVHKGDEKGYFLFGGSCVITIFEPGRVQFAADLIEHSAQRAARCMRHWMGEKAGTF